LVEIRRRCGVAADGSLPLTLRQLVVAAIPIKIVSEVTLFGESLQLDLSPWELGVLTVRVGSRTIKADRTRDLGDSSD